MHVIYDRCLFHLNGFQKDKTVEKYTPQITAEDAETGNPRPRRGD